MKNTIWFLYFIII